MIIPFLLVFIQLARTCFGHALMCTPRQRASYNEVEFCGSKVPVKIAGNITNDFCGHCLNAGGKETVRAHLPSKGWTSYDPTRDFETLKRAGLCGDSHVRNDHMIGGSFMPYDKVPIVSIWKSGSDVDLMVGIGGNQNGYFEFHLCDLDKCKSKDISERCFKQGHCYRLERVTKYWCQHPKFIPQRRSECGPIDINYRGRWVLPCPQPFKNKSVHRTGGRKGTMRYKLPKGVTCKHCVVQWYWATADTCNPHGFIDYFERYSNPFGKYCKSAGNGKGAHNKYIGDCYGKRNPEEFWSCADVQITWDGKPWGTVKVNQSPSPGSKVVSSDGRLVQNDPEAARKASQNELEEDLNMNNRENWHFLFADGKCYEEHQPCSIVSPCCNVFQVCVYTVRAGTFSCRFWWELYQEVEAQRSLRG